MKSIITYINEKLKIRKNAVEKIHWPDNNIERQSIIKLRISNDNTYLDLTNIIFNTNNPMGEVIAALSFEKIDHNTIETIDLTDVEFGDNVKYLQYMFCNFDGLKNVIGFDTINFNNVTELTGTFFRNNIETIEINGANLDNIKSIKAFFKNCTSLKSVTLRNWRCSNLTDVSQMFYGCENLEEVNGLETWQNFNPKELVGMFIDCVKLKTVDISTWNTSNVTYTYDMFCGCTNLEKLDLSKWNCTNFVWTSQMFLGCSKLKTLGNFMSNVKNNILYVNTSCKDMFNGCKSLKLDLSHLTIVTTKSTNFAKDTNKEIFISPKIKRK